MRNPVALHERQRFKVQALTLTKPLGVHLVQNGGDLFPEITVSLPGFHVVDGQHRLEVLERAVFVAADLPIEGPAYQMDVRAGSLLRALAPTV